MEALCAKNRGIWCHQHHILGYGGTYMLKRRTDLALEAAQLWQESAGEAGTLPGVESEEATREGYPVTTVRIRDEAGARALGKPL